MAHAAQKIFCESIKAKYPKYFTGNINVIDVGSMDINGNNRYLFTGCRYTGIDVSDGPNVDIVGYAHMVLPNMPKCTTIISTECLEHDYYYPLTLRSIYRRLVYGGLMIITCASNGRAEHGTKRTGTHYESPGSSLNNPNDYYFNLCEKNIRDVFMHKMDDLFIAYGFEYNPDAHDLYFYGISRNSYSYHLSRI